MPVLLHLDNNHRKKDMNKIIPPFDSHDRSAMPVTGKAVDYDADFCTAQHRHPSGQLIHAVRGVMVVSTAIGQWIVPPTRGIWMPPETTHWVRMVGEVHMRTVYIRHDAITGLPLSCKAVGISPLLRELILEAIHIPQPYAEDSRAGHLIGLLLDEVGIADLAVAFAAAERCAPADHLQGDGRRPERCIDAGRLVDTPAYRCQNHPAPVRPRNGHELGQWRQQARLLRAFEQLAGGTKVVDVALNMGYASPSAFATMFKRQFGVVPSDFFKSTGKPPHRLPIERRNRSAASIRRCGWPA